MKRTPPSQAPELMDREDCDPKRLRDAHDVLTRVNRRLGVRRLVTGPALPLLERRDGPIRMLDVGAGAGDLAGDLATSLSVPASRLRVVVADVHAGTLEIARDRLRSRLGTALFGRMTFVRLTAPALPFPEESFDLAYSSSMLHHLERGSAIHFFAELSRVSGGRWIVSDLRRSVSTYLAVRLLSATVWRGHPFPRRDGPVSVRRAFTREETLDLLREAHVADARVRRRWPFRLQTLGPEVDA